MKVFPKALSKRVDLNNPPIVAVLLSPGLGICGLCCILKDCMLSCWIIVLVVNSLWLKCLSQHSSVVD